MRRWIAVSLATGSLGAAHAAEFRTPEPLKAFVYGAYSRGSDYFIHGNQDTYVLRCLLTRRADPFEGVALSEISIWGNRSGPWEIFRKEESGSFVYVETRELANTACLESCRSSEYLAAGRCSWRRGWPRQ